MSVHSIQSGVEIPLKEANDACIEVLRDLLARAEAGEITSFAGAYGYYDGSTAYRLAGVVSVPLLGSLYKVLNTVVNEV